MMKPIPDKAEVVLEYPDKFYIGTFERSARFEAHMDEAGISLTLYRGGEEDTRKSVRMHIHYALFADILDELAKSVAAMPGDDAAHRDALAHAAQALHRALVPPEAAEARPQSSDQGETAMAADEEVKLLHILE
jgi:hypothetical protein